MERDILSASQLVLDSETEIYVVVRLDEADHCRECDVDVRKYRQIIVLNRHLTHIQYDHQKDVGIERKEKRFSLGQSDEERVLQKRLLGAGVV